MFFTTAGRVIAYLTFALRLLLLVIGFSNVGTEGEAYIVKTFPVRSAGELMDRGIYILVAGVVIGILTDISRSLAARD